MTVSEIADRLDERAFGLLILVLSIPCLVPGLPGAQVIAVPILLLALQLAVGRVEPWLPGWFRRIRVKSGWLQAIADFTEKRLGVVERIARPRWKVLATGAGERIAGLVMAIAALCIALPITNTIPSIALVAMSIGLLERDGVFVLLGGLVAVAWATLLAGLVVAVVYGLGSAPELAERYAPWLADLFDR
jgi:hypothetical protein